MEAMHQERVAAFTEEVRAAQAPHGVRVTQVQEERQRIEKEKAAALADLPALARMCVEALEERKEQLRLAEERRKEAAAERARRERERLERQTRDREQEVRDAEARRQMQARRDEEVRASPPSSISRARIEMPGAKYQPQPGLVRGRTESGRKSKEVVTKTYDDSKERDKDIPRMAKRGYVVQSMTPEGGSFNTGKAAVLGVGGALLLGPLGLAAAGLAGHKKVKWHVAYVRADQ
jgi:hypothetical protein